MRGSGEFLIKKIDAGRERLKQWEEFIAGRRHEHDMDAIEMQEGFKDFRKKYWKFVKSTDSGTYLAEKQPGGGRA